MRLEIMRRTDMALRALRALDAATDLLQASELAERTGTTPQFIPQVLKPLLAAGWIASEPGPRGGYRLTTPLHERSLLDLIETVEGPTDDGRCVLQGSTCTADDPCSLHDAWTLSRAALVDRLASIPIGEGREKQEGGTR